MGIKKGQVLELDITDIAFGGKGLARVNNFAVFVDQAVPRDRVIARIIKKKKRHAEARIVEILEPSPHRITPKCRYSGFCGGCKWQGIEYDKQLEYKRNHVSESIERIGMIKDVMVRPVISSEKIFGYRNKMEFSCSDRRWLLPEEMGVEGMDTGFALGLHVPGTFYKVLDTEKCFLHPDMGNRILDDVRTFIRKSNIPVYGLRSHEGFWRFVMLRHSAGYDQWMVNIITASEDIEAVRPLGDMLLKKYPEIVSVVNNITSRKAGIAIGEYEVLLGGEPYIKDKIGKYEFKISANSFFQTNTAGAQKLYQAVKEYVSPAGNEMVVDLYSGTGTIPIWISDSVKQVIGIEINQDAVADAEKNCRDNGVSNCRFIAGDIRDKLIKITDRPDVMIIDPPRDGMHKDVVKRVLEIMPGKIVYVSCNPSTLARDLNMMNDKFRVVEIQPIDMFPHTPHIEAVAAIERIK